jgi:hypothetical protein
MRTEARKFEIRNPKSQIYPLSTLRARPPENPKFEFRNPKLPLTLNPRLSTIRYYVPNRRFRCW